MSNISKLNIGGNLYSIEDKEARKIISDEYDPAKSYVVRNFCIKDNVLYKCIKDTTGIWDSTCWKQTNIEAEFSALNTNLIDFMISKYVGTTYSISGNGAATLQFLLPIVDGYTPVFYIVRGSGNSNVFPSAFGGYINAGNTSVSTIVKNTGTALSDITASIAVMYIKTVFVTQFFVP